MTQTHDLTFDPPLDDFINDRHDHGLTVLCGGNNSGKSLMLKNCKLKWGSSAYMVGTVRFYHLYEIGTALRDPNQLTQLEQQFRSQFYQPRYNYEQNFIDLNQILIGLNDEVRNRLFHLAGELLGSTVTLRRVAEDNDLSMRYIDVDGRNLSVSSTGTRLLLTLLGICMDDRFDTLLIDEPELGLSPRVQQSLADFFQDADKREMHFPHLRRVVMATHSHLFLDRGTISNNFSVSKDGQTISYRQIATINELHKLQFNMLGNSLEALHLPAAIVVVEGKTDLAYIDRLIQLRFPARRITVVAGQGDVKRVIRSLSDLLGDLQTSPLRPRLFAVLDSVHDVSLQDSLRTLGVLSDNIVVWSRNGIEYLYPEPILCNIFSVSPEELNNMSIDGDIVTLNDLSYRKAELQSRVVRELQATTQLPAEIEERLLNPLTQSLG